MSAAASSKTPPPPPRRDPTQQDIDEASSLLRSTVERDLLSEICHPERSSSRQRGAPTPSSASPPWKDDSSPKCRPWSEADFFRRLRTFTPQTWFGKSLAVAAPRCAAQGWTNVGVDTLACEVCHAPLVVDNLGEPAPDVLASSHAATCPWQTQSCAPDVSQFPLATTECLVEHTARRLAGCRCLLAAYKGKLAVNVPEGLAALLAGIQVQGGGAGAGRDSTHSLTLQALVRRLEECQQDTNATAATVTDAGKDEEAALVLALYGWEASQQQQQQQPQASSSSPSKKGGQGWVLGCGLCGRRVEVGRVVDRRSSVGSGRVMEGEGRAKARRVGGGGGGQEAASFDPVTQHRVFCVWMERGLEETGQPGWRQTLKALVSRMRRVVAVGGLLEDTPTTTSNNAAGGATTTGTGTTPEQMYQTAKSLLDAM